MTREEYINTIRELRNKFDEATLQVDQVYSESCPVKIGQPMVMREVADLPVWDYDYVLRVTSVSIHRNSGNFNYETQNYFTREPYKTVNENQVALTDPSVIYKKVKRLL